MSELAVHHLAVVVGDLEVAERFYMQLVPQVRELCAHAAENGQAEAAAAVTQVLDEILVRPEHQSIGSAGK